MNLLKSPLTTKKYKSENGSISLFLIGILPTILIIGSILLSNLYVMKGRQELEHLCYTKKLLAQASFANLLNYLEIDHNPEAKGLEKKRKALIKMRNLSPEPSLRKSLHTMIKAVEFKQYNLRLKTSALIVRAIKNRKEYIGELLRAIRLNTQLVKFSISYNLDQYIKLTRLPKNNLYNIREKKDLFPTQLLSTKSFKNILFLDGKKISKIQKTSEDLFSYKLKIQCASHITKRRNRWIASLTKPAL